MTPPTIPALRAHLRAIVDAGLRAVSAETLTTQPVVASSRAGRVIVIAAGKPASAMVRGFMRAVAQAHRDDRDPGSEQRHGTSGMIGMIATAHAGGGLPDALRLFVAGHPVPTEGSVAAGRHALALARAASPEDRLVVLLSGGASALLAAPADGLTLDDKMQATRALLAGGAAIHELNGVRKHLSAIKGGRLAAAARCPVHTFALSDVISPVDDDPGVIGSGPTVADATTFEDALAAIDRLGARASMPRAALDLLEAGAAGRVSESPKPGDPRLAHASYTLIGSRRDAMSAARVEAERLGFTTFVIDEAVSGEARGAAVALLAQARALVARDAAATGHSRSTARGDGGGNGDTGANGGVAANGGVVADVELGPGRGPYCVIASGETTVRVTGTGRGGRNQEFALALADALAADAPSAAPGGAPSVAPGGAPLIVVASVGTDGIDGPTDAAGGIVDPTTARRLRERGLGESRAFLVNNDAYHALDALGDLIKTGPTETNVGDLQIILIG